MLRKVLWLSAACAVLLAALAASRMVHAPERASAPAARQAPVVAERAAPPAETAAPRPEPPPQATAAPIPEDVQVQEDAAAAGLTTLEPPEAPAASPPGDAGG